MKVQEIKITCLKTHSLKEASKHSCFLFCFNDLFTCKVKFRERRESEKERCFIC